MRAHFLSNRHHIHWQLAVSKGGQDIDGSTMGHLAPFFIRRGGYTFANPRAIVNHSFWSTNPLV
jgi:hypothetical protein